MSSNRKLSLPNFLKVLTADKLPMAKAMVIASNVYKTCSTPELLSQLTDSKLQSLGVDGKDERKLVLAAIKKAGYKKTDGSPSMASSSSPSKKRKRTSDSLDMLPSEPQDDSAAFGSFEFNEILEEAKLLSRHVVVNRAPVMTAWAMVVAERLGFKREEALSIASAYTEMNAISKGVALGIFTKEKGEKVELSKHATQPYVDLMGRRPLYTVRPSEQWRALLKEQPVPPSSAFVYLTNSFRQTLPFVIGALRLLADSYSPTQLNKQGFSLYADFRPEVDEWGKRAEFRLDKVLKLRKAKDDVIGANENENDGEGRDFVNGTEDGPSKEWGLSSQRDRTSPESQGKRTKTMSVEEYEAALDAEEHLIWTEDL